MRFPVALLAVGALAGCATTPPAPAPPVTVVTFGDSVPAGTACDCTPFPGLYATMLSPAAESDDLAEAGATSLGVRRQLATGRARAEVRRANVVLIMAGANDVAADLDDGSYTEAVAAVRANVTAAVSSVRQLRPGVAVLVFGYWNVVEDGEVGARKYDDDRRSTAGAATLACNAALLAAAADAGATYVDTLAPFKGSAGTGDPTPVLAADGDHPNAAGHALLAQAAYRARATP
ncbi:hypothetical protein GCM10020358_61860 [Amorphoplanes nipponensis]|uniref:SGNH hydrolase-type esterase domain-containing protein n=1 Tax=Actinoplanes nipponensis TaxID=135950 RepID=A0A919MTU7_9ACTN|nr:SGNH/GDSL hydrolase family protein [Actinoplanes nipponensis]GIE53988.1 hypothetical protein Ani05nite_75220 [Actinoplanes nipponensis]